MAVRIHSVPGLSPRVRGNPPCHRSVDHEPEVYPRVCGGTSLCAVKMPNGWGLSPRVRGNPKTTELSVALIRSIPACAGEPGDYQHKRPARGVYPRVCGGTDTAAVSVMPLLGLSPRVRGNRRWYSRAAAVARSIPACAGEPVAAQPKHRRLGGLSPRVRGNHIADGENPNCCRSIPACAGEPRRPCTTGGSRRVYPRVCGGTDGGVGMPSGSKGLSPRVRGNPAVSAYSHRPVRSIPACAGEPKASPPVSLSISVYPRVCGGTTNALIVTAAVAGLSPACAGEP